MKDFKTEGQELLMKVLEAVRENDGGGEQAAFLLCQALKRTYQEGAGWVPPDPGKISSWDGRAKELGEILEIKKGDLGLFAQHLAMAYSAGHTAGRGEAGKLTEAGRLLFRDLRDGMENLRSAIRVLLKPRLAMQPPALETLTELDNASSFARVMLDASETTMRKLIKAIDE